MIRLERHVPGVPLVHLTPKDAFAALSLVTMLLLGCANDADRRTILRDHNGARGRERLLPDRVRNSQVPVRFEDGVDRDEAYRLAKIFLRDELNVGCGAVGRPLERANTWLVPVYEGYAGEEAAPLVMDRVSGKVSRLAGSTRP